MWLRGFLLFVFFKQKTAYEMRISDWSSDVCSSDLPGAPERAEARSGTSRAICHRLDLDSVPGCGCDVVGLSRVRFEHSAACQPHNVLGNVSQRLVVGPHEVATSKLLYDAGLQPHQVLYRQLGDVGQAAEWINRGAQGALLMSVQGACD